MRVRDTAVRSAPSWLASPLVERPRVRRQRRQPPSCPNQTCAITGGSGNLAGADIASVQACEIVAHSVGGNVVGLHGNGLVLQLDDSPVPADGAFVFSQPLQEGASHAVTIPSQPCGGGSDLCFIANGNGTMNTQAVSGITVTCDVIFLSGFEGP